MTHAGRWLAAAGWALVLTLPGGAVDPSVPDADYPKLVAQQIKVAVEALKAAQGDDVGPLQKKRMAEKAKAAVIVIAQAAQDNLAGADAGQRLALRDAAAAVALLLPSKEPKLAEALKLAETLASVKPNASAKKDKIPLMASHANIDAVMAPFKNIDKGGQDLEKLFLKLSFDKKKNIPPAQMGEPLQLALYQTALLAELTRDHKVEKEEKKWQALSDDMRRTALEMADGIRAKDGKAAFAALTKLNQSCTVCHEVFRDAGQ